LLLAVHMLTQQSRWFVPGKSVLFSPQTSRIRNVTALVVQISFLFVWQVFFFHTWELVTAELVLFHLLGFVIHERFVFRASIWNIIAIKDNAFRCFWFKRTAVGCDMETWHYWDCWKW
jgi:hypothetical protein